MTRSARRPDAKKALAEIFGFAAFRPHQEEIVDAILAGRDVFAVMPTGGGKSLCYQLPACLLGGVTVVVSPLISLMKDQVDAANSNGIAAATLNSSLSDNARSAIYAGLRGGDVRLLYISPERFNAPGFIDYLKTLGVAFFAIDEAHCISEWGHDFRPDYLSLASIAREFPATPIAAFTATATPRVAHDIVGRLGLRDPHLTRASFNRPNLVYRVVPKTDFDEQLLAFLRERSDESGIVYRTTRKKVDATAAMLTRNGIAAKAYHAGMSDVERARAQEDFRNDRCQVVVATIAFGMGIDKPNVRFVAHGDLPKNIEGYYQETGRAGRDGEPACCILFHNSGDLAQLLRFNSAIVDESAKRTANEQLNRMAAFARNDCCRRAALLNYFGEQYPEENCGGCDVCLGEVEREDATRSAQMALSAMARTGGRFGAVHIADILIGADTEKIRQNGHDRLPTHGVGKDRDKAYWRRVIEAVIAKGLAAVRDADYPVPAVTEAGWRVMRGEETFMMLKGAARTGAARRGRETEATRTYSAGLFKRLKQLRARLAEDRGLPAYMIFPDRTLREMARTYPGSQKELLEVPGIGQHKLAAFGDAVLAEIAGYLAENPKERPQPRTRRDSEDAGAPVKRATSGQDAPRPESTRAATEQETLRLLSTGMGIEEVAARRGLGPETIVTHMEKLRAAGVCFPADRFMTPDRLEMIAALFRANGSTRLKPLVEASNGEIGYLEARLARLFLDSREGA